MSTNTEALAARLEDLCHDWTIAHECAAEMRRLAVENARLIEDRVRFPDRHDDIGRMVGAHVNNLKSSIKTNENAWRGQLARADGLERDAARYRFVRTADTLLISAKAARDPVAYDEAIDEAMTRAAASIAASQEKGE